MDISENEFLLIGAAVIGAQRLEFALYGLAAHAAHTDAAKKDKHFKNLNPEEFLRGDLEKQKATLGRLVNVFGDAFLIRTKTLEQLIDDRNLIVHNYWRVFVTPSKGVERRTDGEEFLKDFIKRASGFTQIFLGFVYRWAEGAARKEGRTEEFVRTEFISDAIAAYERHVAAYLAEKAKIIKRE